MTRLLSCLLVAILPSTLAFNSQTQNPRRQDVAISEKIVQKTPQTYTTKRRACDPCHKLDNDDDDNDLLVDRREAAFAMLGALWASSTSMASATTGDEARLAFPDPLQSMSDRVGKQCLVESLGNRECLVYMDQNAMLYKGADYQALLTRIETAYGVLKDQLPPLIESKKWSQVSGVLTGPLGDLVRTMNQMAKLVNSEKIAACEKQVQVVKKNLYAIAAAVEKKDDSKAMAEYEAAVKNLGSFIVDYS